MHLNTACFPGKLHFLPAGPFDQIILNQQIRGKQARDSADTRVPDFTASHHRVPDDLPVPVGVMPAFIPNINPHSVGPVDFTILNHPMMSSVAGNRSSLRYRSSCRRMGAGQALHFYIRKKGFGRREALLPACQFDQMFRRVPVILQPEMNGLPVGLYPVGAGDLCHLIIQSHLNERFSIAEYHSPSVQISGHIRFFIFNKKPVMKDIHSTEGIVSDKFVLQISFRKTDFPDLNFLRRFFCAFRRKQNPALASAKYIRDFRSLDDHLSISIGFIAYHFLRPVSAEGRTHALPIHAAMNLHTASRPCHICRRLNSLKRVLCAAVIFIGSGRGHGIYMVFPPVCLLPFPEHKSLSVRQTVLRIPFHYPRYGEHGSICLFRPISFPEQQRKALCSPEAGQPALLILQPPESHIRHIGCAFLLRPYQNGKQSPVAVSQRFHGNGGRVRVMNIQLRHMNFQPQRAVGSQALFIFGKLRLLHGHMGLHPHTVHQSFREQRLQDAFADHLPFPRKEGIVIIIKKAD